MIKNLYSLWGQPLTGLPHIHILVERREPGRFEEFACA